jgi:cytochrome c
MFRITATLLLAIAASLWSTRSASAQNADNGRQTFRQVCSICHEVAAGRNRVGPSLFGVVGRKAGTGADFHYSDEMKNAGLTWDDATLDRFLGAPRAAVAGTKMAYAGVKDDQKRRDLIAYLATLH